MSIALNALLAVDRYPAMPAQLHPKKIRTERRKQFPLVHGGGTLPFVA